MQYLLQRLQTRDKFDYNNIDKLNKRTIHLIRQTMYRIHAGNLTFRNGIHPIPKMSPSMIIHTEHNTKEHKQV